MITPLASLPLKPIQDDKDGERTCGTCLERKSTKHFYRDGKDNDGCDKYRRDCKDCYRINRLHSRRAKRLPEPEVKPKRRRNTTGKKR
ncbi:hypothetical protein D3C79_629430 [compost metagenome]